MLFRSEETIVSLLFSGLLAGTASAATEAPLPADVFDLSNWYLTLPIDADSNGVADIVNPVELQHFSSRDYFYVTDENNVVFVAPNKGTTTPNSSNSRTELRGMLLGHNQADTVNPADPRNNFVLSSHPDADNYAQIGGSLAATLRVEHVAVESANPDHKAAYSVVVGQIHAGKSKDESHDGYGYGNEPLKIFYKKRPGEETGSVFWTYERNLAKDDPDRTDICYTVWGRCWKDKTDPASEGIEPGEEFSYRVEVNGDMLVLEFSSENHPDRRFELNLANNTDANGEVDELDNPDGYTNDWMYFKAGAYNQCNTKPTSSYCRGTGKWETDKANGDYAQVVFSELAMK
ncbi:polysaccharide lyase family 7 protein [Granulosicoccaceae sp. 1_MG-2023]|nr:polysaccharide lyase family 7 protein [Granulosicoccaceae sp. 1_MG-2023]